MGGFSRLRIGSALAATLAAAGLLTSVHAAAAQPSAQQALPAVCAVKETHALNGYEPRLALEYRGIVVKGTPETTQVLQLSPRRQYSQGDIAGTAELFLGGQAFESGTWKGSLDAGKMHVKGSIIGIAGGQNFSFTGMTTCLRSQVDTTDMTSDPLLGFSSHVQFTSQCFTEGQSEPDGATFACIAEQVRDGIAQATYLKKVPDDGAIPYVSGGGHGTKPVFTGKGLDCSGFTRLVDVIAWNVDVLGKTNAAGQARELHANRDFFPGGNVGDIVFWRADKALGRPGHVGIVIGRNYMLDEPNGGKGSPPHNLRVDRISTFRKNEKPGAYYVLTGN
jgi:hypothetical protein